MWAQAAMAAGQAVGQAAAAPPAISGAHNANRVTIGGPVWTHRASAAGVANNLVGKLPIVAMAGVAGLVLWQSIK